LALEDAVRARTLMDEYAARGKPPPDRLSAPSFLSLLRFLPSFLSHRFLPPISLLLLILDVTFPSTREAKFLSNITHAISDGDVESFTAHVVDFDQITKLDNLKTELLLKIKKSIVEEGGLA
jgi:hypothetical protein